MAQRVDVMRKRGFNKEEYKRFASGVGVRITFNRKMAQLAEFYSTSIFHLSQVYENSMIQAEENDPMYLLLQYKNLINTLPEDFTVPGIIAREIRPTPLKSFLRYGDKNCLTGFIKRNYISEDGTPLDVQAMNMEDQFFQEITPDTLIEFIYSHEKGPLTYRPIWIEEAENIQSKIQELTGVNVNESFVEEFEKVFCQKSVVTYNEDPF